MSEKILGCIITNKQCQVNHCHVCKQEQDRECICKECTVEVRDIWSWHLKKHEANNERLAHYEPYECNICASILEGMIDT